MKRIFSLILLLIAGVYLKAQTWNGSAGTAWSTAANWTPAVVPTATSNVTIPGALVNYPVLSGDVTINSINMAAGSQLDVNGFSLTLNGVSSSTFFTNATLNNSSLSTNIVININTGSGGGFAGNFGGNTVNDSITFNITGSNPFIDAYFFGGSANIYTGNVTYNAAGSGLVWVGYADSLHCTGNLAINRTVAGPTWAFSGGATITGNFTYTNLTSGNSRLGDGIPVNIGGTVNITANYTTPDVFELRSFTNLTTGGDILVNKSTGFFVWENILKVDSLTITGYKGSAEAKLYFNNITGMVTIADDSGYTSNTHITDNIITGNSHFTHNGSGIFNDIWGGPHMPTGNYFTGNVIFNAAGGPLFIAAGDSVHCSGNLTINRTAEGYTQAFSAGSTITGNLAYTNNEGGDTYFGFTGSRTSIGGTVNITLNNITPGVNVFEMSRLINLTTGGIINVKNSKAFTVQNDTLKVDSLNITGYRGASDANFLNNSVTGHVTTADDASYSGGYYTYINNNVITGNTSFSNNGSNTFRDAFSLGSDNKYTGNLTYIRTGGVIEVAVGGGGIEVTQNLTLNSASGITLGKIKFNGSTNGAIEQLGTQPVNIQELSMEKTGTGKITLNDSVTVTIIANFVSGNIHSSAGNNLIFPAFIGYSGSSNASYIDGPVTKKGLTAFTFPVGQANKIAPISISAPAAVTDEFRAQYFNHPAHNDGYDSTSKDSTLHHLSNREYWKLDRIAGTSNVFVTLSWETSRSGSVTSLPDLRIARWNGIKWKNEGNGGTTGTTAAGTIQSFDTVRNFSPFTLASSTFSNPLPVTLVHFAACKCNGGICVFWVTENEQDLSHFDVEKSTDGINFLSFDHLPARNNNGRNSYTSTDINPGNSDNFYRLKIFNPDGRFKYSAMIRMNFSKAEPVSLQPNPASDIVFIKNISGYSRLRIVDMSGKIKQQKSIHTGIEELDISHLCAGIYVLQLMNNTETTTMKLVKY